MPPERNLQDAATTDLPELRLVDQAAFALGFFLTSFDEDTSASPAIGNALVLVSIMAFRSARASGLLIASGYSSEALTHVRRLAEFSGQATRMVQDRSEKHAKLWLQGRGGKPGRSVDPGFWKELSPSAHADVRHLNRVSEVEKIGVRFFPSRFSQDWQACVMTAIWAKELAYTVHREAQLDVAPLETLDHDIDDVLDRRSSQLTLW